MFIAERLNVGQAEDEVYDIDETPQPLPVDAENLTQAMQAMVDDALAAGVGAVEKINFDELVFDDDE